MKDKDKGYEHEIVFHNGQVEYVVSTTFYLNEEDRQYLTEQDVDLTNVKSVKSYKL
jgi:hypothetical protein